MASSYQPAEEGGDGGIVAEINITPLTDVFLVLLIIFMVTTSVIHTQSKNVDLPGAEVSEVTPSGVTVTVTEQGQVLVNDQLTAEADLHAALEAALTDASDKIVILRGDASIALGRAVNVLDLAQKAGAKGIAISTEQPEEEILIAP